MGFKLAAAALAAKFWNVEPKSPTPADEPGIPGVGEEVDEVGPPPAVCECGCTEPPLVPPPNILNPIAAAAAAAAAASWCLMGEEAMELAGAEGLISIFGLPSGETSEDEDLWPSVGICSVGGCCCCCCCGWCEWSE